MIESSSVRLRPWMDVVALVARAARPVCLDGPVRLDVEFVLRRPRRTKYADAPYGTPDLDKLVRAVGDALTGIAWVDDAQVVASSTMKRWTESGEKSGARIVVAAWTA